jgi:hypothetical protein
LRIPDPTVGCTHRRKSDPRVVAMCTTSGRTKEHKRCKEITSMDAELLGKTLKLSKFFKRQTVAKFLKLLSNRQNLKLR